MNKFLPAIFFMICLCCGLWVTNKSWNGLVYVYVGEHRSPAAIRSITEYSAIDHQALYRTVQSQLLAFAEIYKEGGKLGVQLGHPILIGKNGGKEFGCQVADHSGVYDRLQLTFIGTGITEDGEAPRMIVDSACRSQEDLNQLETIWIPMDSILENPAKDQAFELGGENLVQLRFEAMPSAWPENWVLWNVRFYRGETPEDNLVIDSKQLKQGTSKLLSFDWKVQ